MLVNSQSLIAINFDLNINKLSNKFNNLNRNGNLDISIIMNEILNTLGLIRVQIDKQRIIHEIFATAF
jgi:hypothetical protein